MSLYHLLSISVPLPYPFSPFLPLVELAGIDVVVMSICVKQESFQPSDWPDNPKPYVTPLHPWTIFCHPIVTPVLYVYHNSCSTSI